MSKKYLMRTKTCTFVCIKRIGLGKSTDFPINRELNLNDPNIDS